MNAGSNHDQVLPPLLLRVSGEPSMARVRSCCKWSEQLIGQRAGGSGGHLWNVTTTMIMMRRASHDRLNHPDHDQIRQLCLAGLAPLAWPEAEESRAQSRQTTGPTQAHISSQLDTLKRQRARAFEWSEANSWPTQASQVLDAAAVAAVANLIDINPTRLPR